MSEDGPSPNFGGSPQAPRLAVDVLRHGDAWDHSLIADSVVTRAARTAFATGAPMARGAATAEGAGMTEGAAIAKGGASTTASRYEVTIVLTDDAEIQALNRTWRNKDAPTNVLSFPVGEAPRCGGALGDIVIAFETAHTEAKQSGIALSDHVSHLAVHGVLHLLGFDHIDDTEAERMEDLERKVLASLGIADPYRHTEEARLAEISR